MVVVVPSGLFAEIERSFVPRNIWALALVVETHPFFPLRIETEPALAPAPYNNVSSRDMSVVFAAQTALPALKRTVAPVKLPSLSMRLAGIWYSVFKNAPNAAAAWVLSPVPKSFAKVNAVSASAALVEVVSYLISGLLSASKNCLVAGS